MLIINLKRFVRNVSEMSWEYILISYFGSMSLFTKIHPLIPVANKITGLKIPARFQIASW